jgi:multidrug efflux pump subunit AcrA (membrane-fusion protein)
MLTVLLLLSAVIAVPEVQTALIERRAANGEVRAIQFINLTAEISGRVTDIFVKEDGDDRSCLSQVSHCFAWTRHS